MKQVLCFGDSNTWGYNPKTGDSNSYTLFWIVCVLISAVPVIYTGINLFKNEKKVEKNR